MNSLTEIDISDYDQDVFGRMLQLEDYFIEKITDDNVGVETFMNDLNEHGATVGEERWNFNDLKHSRDDELKSVNKEPERCSSLREFWENPDNASWAADINLDFFPPEEHRSEMVDIEGSDAQVENQSSKVIEIPIKICGSLATNPVDGSTTFIQNDQATYQTLKVHLEYPITVNSLPGFAQPEPKISLTTLSQSSSSSSSSSSEYPASPKRRGRKKLDRDQMRAEAGNLKLQDSVLIKRIKNKLASAEYRDRRQKTEEAKLTEIQRDINIYSDKNKRLTERFDKNWRSMNELFTMITSLEGRQGL